MTTLTRRDDICVLGVSGDLNKTTVGQFNSIVSQCLGENAHDFVVNLTDCGGVDSLGLEAITQLNRDSRERLGMSRLCGLNATMKKILEITRLDRQLDISSTVDDAIEALKQ
jgi:anti-anti-sigma factor